MSHQLKQLKDIARRCAIAKLDAELSVIKCQRDEQGWRDLESYVVSPDFERRAAEVKESVFAAITRCEPIKLNKVADELGLPLDAAAVWLTTEITASLSVNNKDLPAL